MYDYLIIGAGLSGSVAAERLASQFGKKILIIEKRSHIAGNVYDEYDENGIFVHKYGPHLFHTNSRNVFEYLSGFTSWRFYEHHVLARLDGKLIPLPVNRETINALYDIQLKDESETEKFLSGVRTNFDPVLNSQQIIMNRAGADIFERLFKNYTKKQWGISADKLLPGVCGRIPVRLNDDCRYFTDRYQYMPDQGYTAMVKKMLSHKNIEVVLEQDYQPVLSDIKFHRIICTAPVDSFYNYEYGKLPYRSLEFISEYFAREYAQEAAQVNYPGDEEWTRIVEYKHITGQKCSGTTLIKEIPKANGEPFYPVPSAENSELYGKYHSLSKSEKNVFFLGRLAEYRYYNMDQVVAGALNLVRQLSGQS